MTRKKRIFTDRKQQFHHYDCDVISLSSLIRINPVNPIFPRAAFDLFQKWFYLNKRGYPVKNRGAGWVKGNIKASNWPNCKTNLAP